MKKNFLPAQKYIIYCAFILKRLKNKCPPMRSQEGALDTIKINKPTCLNVTY